MNPFNDEWFAFFGICLGVVVALVLFYVAMAVIP